MKPPPRLSYRLVALPTAATRRRISPTVESYVNYAIRSVVMNRLSATTDIIHTVKSHTRGSS
jgi:hypothetical protein